MCEGGKQAAFNPHLHNLPISCPKLGLNPQPVHHNNRRQALLTTRPSTAPYLTLDGSSVESPEPVGPRSPNEYDLVAKDFRLSVTGTLSGSALWDDDTLQLRSRHRFSDSSTSWSSADIVAFESLLVMEGDGRLYVGDTRLLWLPRAYLRFNFICVPSCKEKVIPGHFSWLQRLHKNHFELKISNKA